MARPRIFTEEQQREKRRIKQAKWRAANLDRAREITRDAEKRKRDAAALAAGREPGRKGRAPLYTEDEKKAKRAARMRKWYADHPEVLEQAKAREKAKRAGTFVSQALPRLTPEERRMQNIAYANNRKARITKNGGKHTRAEIKALHDLQEGRCPLCCEMLGDDDIHVDHWVPLALGGTNSAFNLRLLHARCNMIKGAQHPYYFGHDDIPPPG